MRGHTWSQRGLAAIRRFDLAFLWPLLLTPAVVWGCWGAPFLMYDDVVHIVQNRLTQPGVPWGRVFQPDLSGAFYYPLTLLVWRGAHGLAELLPAWLLGPHAWATAVRSANLLLHAGAALFVWSIVRQLGGPRPLAGFVSALFALHPTVCESVGWAVETKTVLAACLGLGAVRVYLAAESGRGRAGALLLYVAALLAKPSALGLLPVVVVWEVLGRPRFDSSEVERLADAPSSAAGLRPLLLRALRNTLPWVLVSAAAAGFFVSQSLGAHVLMDAPLGGSLWHAALTDVVILWRYAAHFLWPAGLSACYYVEPVASILSPRLWGALFGLVLLVSVTFALARGRRRLVAFAWLWFVGALGTNLNLVPLAFYMHDRYAYLSSAGCWLAVGLALFSACESYNVAARVSRPVRRFAVVAAVLLLAGASGMRSRAFASSVALFADAVEKEPRSAYAHYYLSGALLRWATQSRGEAADAILREATRQLDLVFASPEFDTFAFPLDAHLMRAELFLKQNRVREAERHLRLAADRARGRRLPPRVLGTLYEVRGRIALARDAFGPAVQDLEKALELRPHRSELRLVLAEALVAMSRQLAGPAQAQACLDRARTILRAIKPADPAYGRARELLAAMEKPPGAR